MASQEVPREQWAEFFDSFSQRHQGWLVTVEILGPDIGDQVEARALPLEGITAELNGDEEDEIDIFVGTRPDSHVTHKINAPLHVRLKQTEQGADEALEIESEGVAALLRFRSAIQPELVDGIA
jgi:hypothetical protein